WTLVAGAATALGTGTLTLTTGIFQLGGAFAIPNAVTLNGAAGSLLVFSGANPVVFTNPTASPYTLTTATAPTIRATTATTFNGIVGVGGTGTLTLESGSLTLTGANTYTGATTVSGGTLT